MAVETTVLLLEAETLPSTLEEQLAKRDVFTEHAARSDVSQVLPVVVPDLVVQSGAIDLEPTLKALQSESSDTPLVVIADRGTIRKLRSERPDAIKALIPEDLPIAAVAHRLATMARRSAGGRPLGKSGPPPGLATPKKAASSEPRVPSTNPKSTSEPASSRGSLAPSPLAPRQQVQIRDPEEEARREREEAEARERAAIAEAEAQQRAVAEARRKKKAEAEAKSREAAAKRRAEIEERTVQRKALAEARKKEQEQRLEERRKEQERKREERRKAQDRKAKERATARDRAKQASLRPAPTESSPSEVRALDELFGTGETPEPVTTRSSRPPTEAMLAESEAAAEALEQTTQAVNISAFATQLDREAERESDRASSPSKPPAAASRRPTSAREEKDEFASVKKKDDLSVIAPLPVDLRVDLAEKANLKPIRLALLDTDLTRADAVAAALREQGMKIHPVTPDPDQTRWPLLRRFAPQGLVVDEKSMARGAAEWVETFRGDPFLRHVPVVLVRFSRLFDEGHAKVTLDPLLHMIEHLGKEEFALLEKLGPGRQVDLWLSQVAPYRLVEMLTHEDKNTRLDCKSDAERMVWHLGPGYAGRGKLADLKTGDPKERLSPEEALSWLLSHEDCQVAVHEHTEPLAHASESRDAEELLREMTDALAAPERHESVRPGAMSRPQKAPSFPATGAPRGAEAPMPPQTGPIEDPPVELPLSRPPLLSADRKEKAMALWASPRASLLAAYKAYSEKLLAKLRPLESKVPAHILARAPWAIPLIVVLLIVVIVSLSGGDDDSTAEAPKESEAGPADGSQGEEALGKEAQGKVAGAKESTAPQEPKDEAAQPEEEEPEDSGEGALLWIVKPPAESAPCEERLGPATPQSKDPIKSVGYWKNARKLLMVGKTDEAIESMCLAGLFDPAGPASEGLAEYYLGQRALGEAERWIKESLAADPERRKSKELLGDIQNQKGKVEESRKLLLDTMKLSGSETKKMALTARKLRQDARLARKGGDLPRAERELRRAMLLTPEDPEVATELGEILLRRQAPEAALRWVKHALKLNPDYSAAKLLGGRVAEAQGKPDKAREFYEMVPLGDPFHKEAQRRRSLL